MTDLFIKLAVRPLTKVVREAWLSGQLFFFDWSHPSQLSKPGYFTSKVL
jgi:hypothetical protein